MSKLWQELRTHNDHGYLWPLTITLVLLLAFAVLYSAGVQCRLNVQCGQPRFAELLGQMKQLEPAPKLTNVPDWQLRYANTYSGHVYWSLTTGLYVLTCLAALFVGARVICKSLPGRCYERITAGATGLVISALVLVCLNYFLNVNGNEAELWRQLVRATVQADVSNIESITRWLDSLGFGMALFLALASWPCWCNRRRTNSSCAPNNSTYASSSTSARPC